MQIQAVDEMRARLFRAPSGDPDLRAGAATCPTPFALTIHFRRNIVITDINSSGFGCACFYPSSMSRQAHLPPRAMPERPCAEEHDGDGNSSDPGRHVAGLGPNRGMLSDAGVRLSSDQPTFTRTGAHRPISCRTSLSYSSAMPSMMRRASRSVRHSATPRADDPFHHVIELSRHAKFPLAST